MTKLYNFSILRWESIILRGITGDGGGIDCGWELEEGDEGSIESWKV